MRINFIILLLLFGPLSFALGQELKTPTDILNLRIRQQRIQIERDAKLGKLTKDQAKSLKAQVEAIRKAELADLKLNGTKTLTDAQLTDLNDQLNTLSKSIPVK